MSGYEAGGAVAVTTSGDGAVHRLSEIPPVESNTSIVGNAIDKLKMETKFLLVIADTGNGSSIKVGPNGAAVFPLPGTVGANILPLQFVHPEDIAFNDQGVSGLKFYVIWGAATDRWLSSHGLSVP